MKYFTLIFMLALGFMLLTLGEGNYRFLLAGIDFLVAYVIYKLIKNIK